MIAILTVLLGFAIGLSLGALGGGGSILTVPALVYVLAVPAQAATTASLVIVGITAAAGAIGHARASHVRWYAGLAFGVIGVPASYLGTALNRSVDPDALLLAFAALMLIVAVVMLTRAAKTAGVPAPTRAAAQAGTGAGGAGTRTALVATEVGIAVSPRNSQRGQALRVVGSALVVGFLTGFLGVGGGFVIVPALVIALGYDMPAAVGTSLLIIAANSAVALVARAGHASFDWAVIVPFTVAAIVGSVAGKRATDHVSSATLSRAFAVLVLLVGCYVAIRSVLAMT